MSFQITAGSRYPTQWISTTRSLGVALKYLEKGGRIAVIELDESQVVDPLDYKLWVAARNMVIASQEMLVEHEVPAEAVKQIISFSEERVDESVLRELSFLKKRLLNSALKELRDACMYCCIYRGRIQTSYEKLTSQACQCGDMLNEEELGYFPALASTILEAKALAKLNGATDKNLLNIKF